MRGTVEDAIKVSRGLEELDYLWIEEPLQEFDIRDTMEIRDGYMYVPQTPGLGREIDWEQIEARTIMRI